MSRHAYTVNSLRLAIVLLVLTTLVRSAWGAGGQYETLYRFVGDRDGAYPFAGLVADNSGNLYGTTNRGGLVSGLCQADWGCGTVFQLQPPQKKGGAWTEKIIYRFGPFAHPAAGLILDSAGNLYGTTPYAGTSNNGTVFRLTPPATPGPAWTYTTLYNFAGGNDGATPVSNLIFDDKGNLYGTTQFGGGGPCFIDQQGSGCGTVFELMPPTGGGKWKEAVLYSFIPANDYPVAGLVRDSKGNLYGTTVGDQSASFGTAFQLSPPATKGGSWKQTTLYYFGTLDGDGTAPYGSLILDQKGNLYGTNSVGGTDNAVLCLSQQNFGYGTVFKLAPPARRGGAWKETVLYTFKGGNDGACPLAALVADAHQNLYGTALNGGVQIGICQLIGGCGTVFQLRPPTKQGGRWTEVTLHLFGIGSDGYEPWSTLIFGKGGSLLGTTTAGGGTCGFPISCGIVFSVTP